LEAVNWELIRLAGVSVASTVIYLLQDIPGVGSEGCMNIPGRASGNWSWRYTPEMLATGTADRRRTLAEAYGWAKWEGGHSIYV
jgi:4-alpha-glucanotransferase